MPNSSKYDRLVRGLTGDGGPRETDYERKNRENRERNLRLEAELRQSREAARLADKMGEKVGIRKDIRDAHTKLFRR